MFVVVCLLASIQSFAYLASKIKVFTKSREKPNEGVGVFSVSKEMLKDRSQQGSRGDVFKGEVDYFSR